MLKRRQGILFYLEVSWSSILSIFGSQILRSDSISSKAENDYDLFLDALTLFRCFKFTNLNNSTIDLDTIKLYEVSCNSSAAVSDSDSEVYYVSLDNPVFSWSCKIRIYIADHRDGILYYVRPLVRSVCFVLFLRFCVLCCVEVWNVSRIECRLEKWLPRCGTCWSSRKVLVADVSRCRRSIITSFLQDPIHWSLGSYGLL